MQKSLHIVFIGERRNGDIWGFKENVLSRIREPALRETRTRGAVGRNTREYWVEDAEEREKSATRMLQMGALI
jgi:hypothetical protein